MPTTARELITRSWYLSGIVSRGAQTVTGDQITDGLYLLNALLDWKTVETDLIPYWTYYTFPTVANQEVYELENIYEIESATFNDGVVRYSMEYITRRNYFGSGRIDNISSLPFNWTFNRQVGGGLFYLYFLPETVYPIKIMAKFGLQNVTLNTDMSLYDAAYREYLRYALAEYMCSEYGIIFNPQSAQILKSMKRTLMYVSPPDLSVIKYSILSDTPSLNWGDVNLGRGYRPS